jgi:Ca2+-binding EF-hand superfamily protein
VINENFEKMDRDGDGKLSRREFVGGRLPMFLEIDADGDGALSITEVSGAYEGRPAK